MAADSPGCSPAPVACLHSLAPPTSSSDTKCLLTGVKPSSGWAIDPFGHSPSMTYLLKGAGLINMVVQRIHYSVKKHFAQQQTLEFLWRQSWGELSGFQDCLNFQKEEMKQVDEKNTRTFKINQLMVV